MTDTTISSPTASDGQPIAYKGVRVMTTERLATEFGTETVRIQQNHAGNRERFREGIHYHKVVGEELKQLKATSLKTKQFDIDPYARHAFLWTERGAFAHAKILGTDEAWNVHERLVDTYFVVKEGKVSGPSLAERRLRVQERITAIRMVDQIIKTKGPQAASESIADIYASVDVRLPPSRPRAQYEMDLPVDEGEDKATTDVKPESRDEE